MNPSGELHAAVIFTNTIPRTVHQKKWLAMLERDG
jgi:hypothetical protein